MLGGKLSLAPEEVEGVAGPPPGALDGITVALPKETEEPASEESWYNFYRKIQAAVSTVSPARAGAALWIKREIPSQRDTPRRAGAAELWPKRTISSEKGAPRRAAAAGLVGVLINLLRDIPTLWQTVNAEAEQRAVAGGAAGERRDCIGASGAEGANPMQRE